jgi:hypothetical protein
MTSIFLWLAEFFNVTNKSYQQSVMLTKDGMKVCSGKIVAIEVDEKANSFLWNGIVSLNRDTLVNLIKIVADEIKIKNVCYFAYICGVFVKIIGMTQIFYLWSKHRVFILMRFNSVLYIYLFPSFLSPIDFLLFFYFPPPIKFIECF